MASWWLKADELRKGIDQVVWAAARPPADPEVLSSVLLECGDEVRLVATDRYRLAISDVVPLRSDAGEPAQAVVPAADLAKIGKRLPDGEVRIEIDDTAVAVSCSAFAERLTLGRDSFPPYQRLLADEHIVSALVDVDELADALEPLQGSKATVVEFVEDGLDVSGYQEPVKTRVAAQVTGKPLTAGFNARYLLESLRAGGGPEVLIEGASPVAPFVFRSTTDRSFTARLMPVKLG